MELFLLNGQNIENENNRTIFYSRKNEYVIHHILSCLKSFLLKKILKSMEDYGVKNLKDKI